MSGREALHFGAFSLVVPTALNGDGFALGLLICIEYAWIPDSYILTQMIPSNSYEALLHTAVVPPCPEQVAETAQIGGGKLLKRIHTAVSYFHTHVNSQRGGLYDREVARRK